MSRRGKKGSRVLVLLDFENLFINYGSRLIIEELNRILKQIAKELGRISKVFVFAPYNTASLFAEDFYRAGFITIACPRIKAKGSPTDIDTTDQVLTEVGKELIDEMPDLTHLCLGSGDIDFNSGDIGFPSLLKKAHHCGLDIAIIASDLRSLSSDLIKQADKKPGTNDKMVYVLSQPEKDN